MVALHKGPSRPRLQNAAVGLTDGALQGLALPGAGGEAVTGPWEERERDGLAQPRTSGCSLIRVPSTQLGAQHSFCVEQGGSRSAGGTVKLNPCPPGLPCTLAMTCGKRLSGGLV